MSNTDKAVNAFGAITKIGTMSVFLFFMYLFFSFVQWNLNPLYWSEFAQYVGLGLLAIFGIFFILIIRLVIKSFK